MTLCVECARLNVTLDALKKHQGGTYDIDSSAVVARRLLSVNEHPWLKQCPVCEYIQSTDHILRASSLELANHVSSSSTTASYQKASLEDSFFTWSPDRTFVRCTYIEDKGDRFARSCTPEGGGGGNRYWEREIFSQQSHIVQSSPDYTSINTWLEFCSQSHEYCRPTCPSELQHIFLVDVLTRQIVPYQRDEQGQCDYIALSYVCGTAITKQPRPVFNKLPHEMPQTIEASIEVVKRLSKRYLWVDCLCINQDDFHEKKRQIGFMHAIYQGAFATIIALDGDHAGSGLPGIGALGPRKPQATVSFGPSTQLHEQFPSIPDQVKGSAWSRRAWTYQEGCLSRRRLVFTQHQVYFLCNEMECCESLDNSAKFGRRRNSFLTPDMKSLSLNNAAVLRNEGGAEAFFHQVVNIYTKRNLTVDNDSLHALSALLEEMKRLIFKDGFLYGLPLVNFRSSLAWSQTPMPSSRDQGESIGRINATTKRCALDIPTWSWARWKLRLNIRLEGLQKPPWVQEIQTPLRVWCQRGTKQINVDAEPANELDIKVRMPSRQVTEQLSRSHPRDNSLVILATQSFYSRLKVALKEAIVEQALHIPVSVQDHHLRIAGIILRFPCVVTPCSKGFTSANKGNLAATVLLPSDVDCNVCWRNDGFVDMIAPLAMRQDCKDNVREHDFLLLSVCPSIFSLQTCVLQIIMLHLYWESDEGYGTQIATRGGVVTLSVQSHSVERFWQHCNAHHRHFWLG